ncbi:SGNH/GDSL hydrolase family protein [Pontibacter sp. 172403-2]|uniref:SGNH/GDSL hydrolase family protein n=1 Tax=Pontibacter rufus TaxID=2791028 RepID=UPI0018B00245|nr:SGNH/GDSL hydrolase family protein [Pontibacter sp. 172403-2]MBF9253909.1 SGNH/GDSL hydrolase family protein [Pontibacter sp. 172403-2]
MANTPSPAAATKYTYLALGDSYTIGEGVPETDQWGMQLAELLRHKGIDISNPTTIARTGWTTSELAGAIEAANLNKTYDLVSLLIGVNNQYRGQRTATYRTEFKELLQMSVRFAKGDPAHVIVLSVPDWGVTPFAQGRDRQHIATEIDAFNAIAEEEAQKAGIPFINITPLTRKYGNDTAYLAPDGLHYSGKMHREWALSALPEAGKVLK